MCACVIEAVGVASIKAAHVCASHLYMRGTQILAARSDSNIAVILCVCVCVCVSCLSHRDGSHSDSLVLRFWNVFGHSRTTSQNMTSLYIKCMCVCVYTYTYTYVHVCVYTYIHTHVFARIHRRHEADKHTYSHIGTHKWQT